MPTRRIHHIEVVLCIAVLDTLGEWLRQCRFEKSLMRYEYKTEGVYLEEKMIGRTTAASGVVEGIAAQFNKAAAQGWELVQVAMVDVIGKIRKSAERRDVAVAIYRRPVG